MFEQRKTQTETPKLKTATDMLQNFRKNNPSNINLPIDFSKTLELSVIDALLTSPVVLEGPTDRNNGRAMLELDEDISLYIVATYYDGYGRYPKREESFGDFLLYSCGLQNVLPNLGIEPNYVTIFHSEHAGSRIAFKIEVTIAPSQVDVALQRLQHWSQLEAKAKSIQESQEIYAWVKSQRDADGNGNQKLISIVTEVGSDVKALLGYAKDLMGVVEEVKKKQETLWRMVRKEFTAMREKK